MIEAEETVVACCMQDSANYDFVSQRLETGDFQDPAFRLMFEIIGGFCSEGRSADSLSVGAVLRQSARWNNLQRGDGVAFADKTLRYSCSAVVLVQHVDIVRNSSIQNRLYLHAQAVADIAQDEKLSADEKLSVVQERATGIADEKDNGFVNYVDACNSAIVDIMRLVESGGGLSGLSTGLSHLDHMTSGFQKGELIILAGRPSMGKTALALNIANAIARSKPVDIFSLEMSSNALAVRSMTSLGRVNFTDLRKGQLEQDAVDRLHGAKRQMAAMDVRIDDRGGISVDELRVRARLSARVRQPGLIVVDYLTLLRGKGENRTAEVGYVSRSLKAMAKELDCAVLALAQLNRGVDSRLDKKPNMSDLRDSGEIEQDADLIMFNYLHEKYDKETPRKGVLELIIAKQRNGETGSIFLDWQGHYQTFKTRIEEVPPMEAKKSSESETPNRMQAVMNGGLSFDEAIRQG